MTVVGVPETLGPTMPSWQLRALLAAVCVGTALAAAVPLASIFALLVLLAVAGATARWPGTHLPAVFLALCALCLLGGGQGLSGRTALVVLGVHATHVLSALAALVPWTAELERAVLRDPARRFVVIQAGSQALVLLTWVLTAR